MSPPNISVGAELDPIADDFDTRAELVDVMIGRRFGSVVKDISADHHVRVIENLPKPKSEIVGTLPLAGRGDDRVGEQEIAWFGIHRKQKLDRSPVFSIAGSSGIESRVRAVRP
jgi:hypothetical protein